MYFRKIKFIYNQHFDLTSENMNGIYSKTLTYSYAETGVKGRFTGMNIGDTQLIGYSYDDAGRISTAEFGNNLFNYTYLTNSNLVVTARDVLPGLLCVTTGIRRHFQYTVSSSFFFPGRENRKRWKENSGSAALPVLDGAAALSSAFRERERRKSARAGGAFPAQGFAGGSCLSLRL